MTEVTNDFNYKDLLLNTYVTLHIFDSDALFEIYANRPSEMAGSLRPLRNYG